ncbi:MAG: tRNA (cytidine(34)-2'-O)-methyltransferase [Bifidobacteriaceae bacterium]|jgi:tRNA (cytidine/uridine-2'-O-)-methyltransferase|nr:tRNA (cytidine(34)-2'-O)-methyltransferase [Bifidobacteriaceae bacterium]
MAAFGDVVNVMFFAPCIPSNTGNAIRLAAVTGCTLHLIEPLGFELTDAKLRRSGLDYHDLADLRIHPDFDAALADVAGSRIVAFTTQSKASFADVQYREDDVLLFGPEPDGLPDWVKEHPSIDREVRIPMLPARRSLNLANCAAIAVYEVWRQQGYVGAL